MPNQDTCALSKTEPPQQLPLDITSNPQNKIDKKSDSLSLDDSKNNCHQTKLSDELIPAHVYCPNPIGHFRGVRQVEKSKHIGVRANIACKSWNCIYCGQKKVKSLIRRILRGRIGQKYQCEVKGHRPSKFEQKFLTLTAPGRVYRESVTPKEALVEMNQNFHKLIRALKKHFGTFDYLKVVEAHKDGFPHFHVLIVGPGIAPKEVLESIRELWVYKYGMGNVDLKVIQKGIKAAVKYITKYITKEIKQICKGSRVFSSSRGALEPLPEKPKWETSRFYFGHVSSRNEGKPEIFEIELFPNMPDRLEWDKVKSVFEPEIQDFMGTVVFQDFP